MRGGGSQQSLECYQGVYQRKDGNTEQGSSNKTGYEQGGGRQEEKRLLGCNILKERGWDRREQIWKNSFELDNI